jgi:hypothetical protein
MQVCMAQQPPGSSFSNRRLNEKGSSGPVQGRIQRPGVVRSRACSGVKKAAYTADRLGSLALKLLQG